MVRHGPLVFPIIIRRVTRRQVLDLIPLDMLVFQLIQILTTYFYRTLLSKNSKGPFHILLKAVHRIIDGPDRPVIKPKAHRARILKFYNTLMMKITPITPYFLLISDHPVQQIDKMAELRVERTPIQVLRALPGVLVIFFIPVPVTVE